MAVNFLFAHSSDEMYGSDRMLLEFLHSLRPWQRASSLVLLPMSSNHADRPLCAELTGMGVANVHAPLPILRRRELNPAGLSRLLRRVLAARGPTRRMNPARLICTTTAALPMAAAVPSTIPVTLYQQELWGTTEAPMLGCLTRNVDQVVSISAAARATLPKHLQSLSTVVPNCTPDPGPCTPRSDVNEIRLLVASRWTEAKGYRFLLSAWQMAGEPGELWLAGSEPELGAGLDVGAVVQELGLTQVKLVGQVDDLDELIRQVDVIAVPTIGAEAFGLVCIEGFARSRPAIVSNTGGLPEPVTPHVGWLVDPNDVVGLAKTLTSLTRSDIRAKGSAARERYVDLYSPQSFQRNLRRALRW